MSDRVYRISRTNTKRSIFKRFAPLFFLFLASVAVALLWPVECLTAKSGDRLLLALPIYTGETFEVTFTHSLNLSPVTDVVEWAGNEMILRKSVFKTFGAGIPVPSDGVGTELVHVDGHYELLGIDKPLQNINIMTQTIPDHYITFREQKISLLSLVGSGKVVQIAVNRVPRLTRLIYN